MDKELIERVKRENPLDFSQVNKSWEIEKLLRHSNSVRHAMNILSHEMDMRAIQHDDDKIAQADQWAKFQLLDKAGYKFGTPEYKAYKECLGVRELIDQHTKTNRHHPEFFDNDLSKMNLVDLVEMISDWYIASSTRASGEGVSFEAMMDIQQKRFNMSDELKSILLNTIKLLGGK